MTKAVLNREICFIKALLLLCEHGQNRKWCFNPTLLLSSSWFAIVIPIPIPPYNWGNNGREWVRTSWWRLCSWSASRPPNAERWDWRLHLPFSQRQGYIFSIRAGKTKHALSPSCLSFPFSSPLFLTTVGVWWIRSGAGASMHALSLSCLSFPFPTPLLFLFLTLCVFPGVSGKQVSREYPPKKYLSTYYILYFKIYPEFLS